ncbi:ATP-binding cassette domain-containing protein [Halosimplex litoreum]|uniref:ATP-binding cassette domain-containing protein n=1 Tax=Halosimplex litoreum TaxID=1198301 RepID=A0A7T3FWD1_9EURY|nr:ATP-binding cassette domain-containing protein [Halosimplex litoreum]QPV61493.1 ATP-binding cassette domain-containing protein [Halosimplex litoreum]
MSDETARPTRGSKRDTDDGDRSVGDDTARSTGDRPLAVDAEGLALTYADGTEAVEDVTLAVPEGQCFGFLGANGAGKTTTIKVLATLLEPTAGRVRVVGRDVTAERAEVRASIGYMAQETSVDEELTARENLAFACDAYGVPADGRADRIATLLDLVDLADVADTPAGSFSGGMKKRLDAATALVHDPELVFLDEPTTGLDPTARERLWTYFRRINDRGTTVFLTTQYLEEADRLCDRIAVVRDGRIVADDSPERLKRRVGGETVALEIGGGPDAVESAAAVLSESAALDSAGADAPAIDTTDDAVRVTAREAGDLGPDLLVALRDAGFAVTGFAVAEPTLDDVFFAIADDSVGDPPDRSGDDGRETGRSDEEGHESTVPSEVDA